MIVPQMGKLDTVIKTDVLFGQHSYSYFSAVTGLRDAARTAG
jgi:ribosomal protein L18